MTIHVGEVNVKIKSWSFLLGLSLAFIFPSNVPAGTREEIYLNGIWQLHLGGDEWKIPSQGYNSCRVPGTFNGREDHECGWYQLDLLIPSGWAGQRITLNFVRVGCFAKVFLDGNLVGDHPDGNTPFSVDITGKAIPGRVYRLNVFVQGWSRFARNGRGTGIWPYDNNQQVGILGDVTLCSSSPVYIDDTFVMTSYRKKTLTAQIWIKNTSPESQKMSLQSLVKLGTREVLNLPVSEISLLPGEVKKIEIRTDWKNPKLWGHPPYGTPTLYHLVCSLKDAKGNILDTSNTRFGFREFWIEGDKFLLNGRPIFLQGEQSEFRLNVMYPHNRQWLTTYFKAMRGANVDFIRIAHGISWPVWAEVADETGMMLEAEAMNGLPTPGFGQDLASGAAVLAVKAESKWLDDPTTQKHLQTVKGFIKEWRNHPSVVMWSTDNEGGSQTAAADVEYFKSIKKFKDLIRSLDPTRPIDHEGSPLISAAKKLGVDLVPEIYNIHPYSDPITDDVNKFSKRHFYSGQPILIGEFFNDYPKIQPPPTPGMPNQKQRWADAQSFADYWYRNIINAKNAGYVGTFILTLANSAFWGFSSEEKIVNGPFGFGVSSVPVTWPSLSGPSPKPESIPNGIPWDSFNWFDPTKPAYIPNYIYARVKEAYRQINGGNLPPLPPTRIPELIATANYQGKPVPEVYLYLVPAEGQPEDTVGILTDPKGTAWFQVPTEGKYTLEYRGGPNPQSLAVDLKRPPCDAKPGYGHIQHVVFDLKDLPTPAVKNTPDGFPNTEPDVVWKCLPQEAKKKTVESAIADSPNTIDLVTCIDEDGVLSKKAKLHRLKIFLKGQDVTKKWKNWNGAIWFYPDNTKADSFIIFMPAPKPGKYQILFHKPTFSPERSADMYIGEDPKPRLNLNCNAADLGFEFCVAGRDAKYDLTLTPKDIVAGQVKLRFLTTSWMPAVIPGITLTPLEK
jgi:hypothetical protein